MRGARDLLKHERGARLFLAAHLQSSLGTGAAYIALLLLAYERFHSPWAITLVLLADFVPAVLLGPLFGAAADRWSRRGCAVIADLARAAAFIGLALMPSFEATLALAFVAGVGSSLFRPAVLAGLPSLVSRERLPAATSLYGAIAELGHTVGPALAAVLLLFIGPEALLAANGATFAASALLLARVPFGRPAAAAAAGGKARPSLLADTREGLSVTLRMPGIRTVVFASTAVVACFGMVNVGELVLATEEFRAGDAGFSLLVAASGVGVVLGSLAASGGGSLGRLKSRYLAGVILAGVAVAASGLAPGLGFALAAFLAGGVANGFAVVHEQLLIQSAVREEMLGRVFGVKNALISGAFTASFLGGGAVLALLGPRPLFLLAGGGVVLAGVAAAVALRGQWAGERAARAVPAPTAPAAPAAPAPAPAAPAAMA